MRLHMDRQEALPRVVDDEAAMSVTKVRPPADDDLSVVEDNSIEDAAGAADTGLIGVTEEGEEAGFRLGAHGAFSLIVRAGA